MEFDYAMGQVNWHRTAWANGVEYKIDDASVGLELDNDKCYLHPSFFGEEPPALEAIREAFEGTDDSTVIARIWFEFRYGIKKAVQTSQVSWRDIQALIEAAMKRVRKEVKDAALKNQVNGRFMVMRKRCDEFIVDPTAAKEAMTTTCPKCGLTLFLCPCSPQDEKLKP